MKQLILFMMICLIPLAAMTGCSGSDSGKPPSQATDDTESQTLNDAENNTTDICESFPSGSNSSAGLSALSMDWDPEDFTTVIDVGPGLDYEEPHLVPWDQVSGSTLVRIHTREEPYRSKWVITTVATEQAPLVVTGICENGERPVITGDNARTLSGLYYLNEGRSVVKVGNYTGEDDTYIPAHVFIENLDIRSCRSPYIFTDRYGAEHTYASSAAAVHIEEGDTITIRGCGLHDSANGLFTSHLTNNILISGNHIFDNGIEGSDYHHNTYTESIGITYEFNHFGPLRDNCGGNNLKDRSAGTVIRYNWIEAGNRQLDLVESDYDSFYNHPSYWETYVYGNTLVQTGDSGNNQVIHYGGDNDPVNHTHYREGTLYLYHNTIVSTRSGTTNLLNLSTDETTAHIRNNIIYTSSSGTNQALTSGRGDLYLVSNWLKEGYKVTHESTSTVDFLENSGNITGDDPGFTDEDAGDFTLASGSFCIDGGTSLPGDVDNYPVTAQYIKHINGMDRITSGEGPDMGAFERDD